MKRFLFAAALLGLSSAVLAGDIHGKVACKGVRDSADAVVYVQSIPGKTFPAPTEHVRIDQQNLTFKHRTPPSLVAAWDMWPMLLSAAAGFAVSASGDYLEARDHDPLRAVLERYSGPEHGNAQALSDAQREDLIAYVKSL